MELDLRFRQYEMNVEQVNETGEVLEKVSPSRPHQEIIDFLEKNKANFSYKQFLSVVKNVHGVLELKLEDGSDVKLGVNEGIVNLGIIYPDKSKFIAAWSNIADEKEFLTKCRNLK